MTKSESIYRDSVIEKMTELIRAQQAQFTDKYVNHMDEIYFGHRSENLHNNIVGISIALHEYKDSDLYDIARIMMGEAMEKDYWYTFIKNWN